MKTITEFTVATLKNALKVRQELVTGGKTPEELPTALGEALKLEGDKLTLITSVMDVVEKKMQDLKRVVVFTLQETEKPPTTAQKNGENYFSIEYFPPMPGQQKRQGHGKDRDDRGGRGGRDGKGGKGGKRGERGDRNGRDRNGPGRDTRDARPAIINADRPRGDRPQKIGGIPVVFAKDTTGPGNPGAPITGTPGSEESRGRRTRRPRGPRPEEAPRAPLLPPDPTAGRKMIQPLAAPIETKTPTPETHTETTGGTN